MGSQSSPMDNLHFQQQYRYKQTLQKNCRFASIQKDHTQLQKWTTTWTVKLQG